MTVDHDRVIRKSLSGLSGDLCTEDRTKGTVCVCYVYIEFDMFTFGDRFAAFLEKDFFIQSFFQFEVVNCLWIEGHFLSVSGIWVIEDRA